MQLGSFVPSILFLITAALLAGMASSAASYSSLLQQLYRVNANNPVKMGLSNAMQMYGLLGSPISRIPIVHVAGTNGKGSVSLKISECLRRSGFKTGLFVSPHISSFRERIQVNGCVLEEDDVQRLLPKLLSLCDANAIPATFFELTTLLGMMKFEQDKCEAVVLEVGLGGRLDSTNIITPALSIITSIQLDHVKILGDTIEKIAMEKAGIMKPGVNVLVGPGCPIDLLREEAKRVGSPFYTLQDVLLPQELAYTSKLQGADDIDLLNVDISRAALRILSSPRHSEKQISNYFARLALPQQSGVGNSSSSSSSSTAIEEGLLVRPPCRFQIFPIKRNQGENVDVILDIAHNEDAMLALVKKVRKKYPSSPVQVVLGMSSDKEVLKCISPLLSLVSATPSSSLSASSNILCVEAKQPRAMKHAELRSIVDKIAADETTSVKALCTRDSPDVREALRAALDQAFRECKTVRTRPVVVVCGSAFIMADARAELGVVEPRDSVYLPADSKDAQENFAATSR